MNNLQMDYQEMKSSIKGELNRVTESFVLIGYRLKQIRDRELYKVDGYSNINEFAKAEYNLSQSTTSRFIAINDKYSVNGSSPKLLEQYEGYGYSKLSEMLTMAEDELNLVTLQTTRAEIREIKQAKKEYETTIYAPAHNDKSQVDTQLSAVSISDREYVIPDAESLLIDLFREKEKREILKELAAVLKSNSGSGWDNEMEQKALEIINPSGYMFHRKGMVILILEGKTIKYNKFGSSPLEFTYGQLVNDITLTFDMAAVDPWVAFYGEPEPEPVIENTVQKKEKPAEGKKKKQQVKKQEKVAPIHKKEDPKEEKEEQLPGPAQIEDYPELLPEEKKPERKCRVCGCTDNHACEGGCYWVAEDLCSACADKISKKNSAAKEVEVVEADIVNTEDNTCLCQDPDEPLIYEDNDLSVSIDGSAGEIIIFGSIIKEKRIKINNCPLCGKPFN